ncbi:MAG: hypothetical protein ABSB32_21710 [Thermodesulfobacteriota bacterium]
MVLDQQRRTERDRSIRGIGKEKPEKGSKKLFRRKREKGLRITNARPCLSRNRACRSWASYVVSDLKKSASLSVSYKEYVEHRAKIKAIPRTPNIKKPFLLTPITPKSVIPFHIHS